MTNATKTLAIIFAGTLVLAVAASWGGGTASSAAFQNQLMAVDTADVQAVKIERTDAPSLRLERSEGNWMVKPADTSVSYPANDQSVEDMLGTFTSLEVGAVATRQSDKHPRYGVDSTAVRVTMLGADDTALDELIVGRTEMRQRPSPGSRQRRPRRGQSRNPLVTYVRSPKKSDVYTVKRSLSTLANRGVEEWRDKRIWTLDRSQIQRIDFSYPADSSFTVRRVVQKDTTAGAPATPGTWVTSGDTLVATKASSLLRSLSSPEAKGFVQERSPDDLGDPLYTLRLHIADGSQRSLQFHQRNSDNKYLVTADGYPYVARLNTSLWDQTVLQGRSHFLQSE